jgi:plasmid stabilization system protein ParE
MTYTVIFSAPAEADLFAIYDYIAERAGGATQCCRRGRPT